VVTHLCYSPEWLQLASLPCGGRPQPGPPQHGPPYSRLRAVFRWWSPVTPYSGVGTCGRMGFQRFLVYFCWFVAARVVPVPMAWAGFGTSCGSGPGVATTRSSCSVLPYSSRLRRAWRAGVVTTALRSPLGAEPGAREWPRPPCAARSDYAASLPPWRPPLLLWITGAAAHHWRSGRVRPLVKHVLIAATACGPTGPAAPDGWSRIRRILASAESCPAVWRGRGGGSPLTGVQTCIYIYI